MLKVHQEYLYAKELILCHLAHSQKPLQSLSTSSTGPSHHCMPRHVLGKPGLKRQITRRPVNDIHFLHILCITTREIIMYTWRLEAILLAALTEKVPHVNLIYMFYTN